MFCRCSAQWRYGPMGGTLGLDYQGVKAVLEMTQPKKKHGAIFTAVQIMERAALDIMNSTST